MVECKIALGSVKFVGSVDDHVAKNKWSSTRLSACWLIEFTIQKLQRLLLAAGLGTNAPTPSSCATRLENVPQCAQDWCSRSPV